MTLGASCDFTPIARPVKPELILAGDYRLIGPLDQESRYVHVERNPTSRTPRGLIVDMRTHRSCTLPVGAAPLTGTPLSAPDDTSEPAFLWPLRVPSESGEDALVFADPHCMLSRSTRAASLNNWKISLDHGRGQALLTGNGRGRLGLVDPWRNEAHLIATGVSTFTEVVHDEEDGEPQSLWLIEHGQLRQRTLDGALRVTGLGAEVVDFEQGAFANRRIAFIDGEDLYEAVAPDFRAHLVAKNACRPSYTGTQLSFLAPCDEQLYRIDLSTGELLRFSNGVLEQWEDGGFVIEYGRDRDGNDAMWATPPGLSRTRVEPVLSNVSVLDERTLSGFSPELDFGIWSTDSAFQALLHSVGFFVGFPDQRSGRLSWVTLHDVEHGLGKVSVLDEAGLSQGSIADHVPADGITGGYLIQVAEPVIVLVRDAKITGRGSVHGYRGTLEAHVLSGQLSSVIDEGVSSFALVPSVALGGVLYIIDQGPRRGLWFAAL